jgi:hypothetical protein
MSGRPARGDGFGRAGGGLLLAAALLAGGTAALILTRHRLFAGLVALAGGAALLAGEAATPRSGRSRELFAVRMLDRVYEATILVPLAWVARAGDNGDALLALVGLGSSYLASYQRAKGKALGYRGGEHPLFQGTRYAILVLALLTGWLFAGLWVFAILTVAAAATRAWNVARQDRRAPSRDGATT